MSVNAAAAAALLSLAISASAAESDYAFDASEFEKKPFEFGGYAELKQERFRLNPDGAFYALNFFDQAARDHLDRSMGTLKLTGKYSHGIATINVRTHSKLQRDEIERGDESRFDEAALALAPTAGVTLEIGKKAFKWGKGYAWNPVGFVERAKDPDDPELGREGFTVVAADLIHNREGALQTVAFTPLLLPVSENINRDFGPSGHLNPAAKLYFLYRDTDIDLLWLGKGSRPARFGVDVSRNLGANVEIHAEWARIDGLERAVTDAAGHITRQRGDATSGLLGLRYLTEREMTVIVEYYRNGTGFSENETQDFYRFVDTALAQFAQSGDASLLDRASLLAQGGYGRANPGRRYLYARASKKDAFDILYFVPALTAIVNLDDRSYTLAPELLYSGVTNLELRLRLLALHGKPRSEFGEKQSANRLELYGRWYF